MKATKIIIFSLAICITSQLKAINDPESLFSQANKLYRDQKFDEAAKLYDSLESAGFASVNLYYNLGNTYYKLEDYPSAILNYERALKLDPGNEDVKFNLKLANLHIPDKIEPIPEVFFVKWWKSLVKSFSSKGWGIWGLICIWVAFLFGLLYVFSGNMALKKIGFFISLILVLFFIFAEIVAYQRYKAESFEKLAIVFSTNAYIKSAPDESSTDLFILHEGVKVEITDEVGQWKEIKLADGKEGWIEGEDLKVI